MRSCEGLVARRFKASVLALVAWHVGDHSSVPFSVARPKTIGPKSHQTRKTGRNDLSFSISSPTAWRPWRFSEYRDWNDGHIATTSGSPCYAGFRRVAALRLRVANSQQQRGQDSPVIFGVAGSNPRNSMRRNRWDSVGRFWFFSH